MMYKTPLEMYYPEILVNIVEIINVDKKSNMCKNLLYYFFQMIFVFFFITRNVGQKSNIVSYNFFER